MDYKAEYRRWLEQAADELKAELKSMDEAAIEDAFYRNLAFGTGGLRGTIGAGTNRMNIHVVAKASQGLSRYLLDQDKKPSVVIGYDSRIKSNVFAKVAAGVFAANGVKVHIWPELLPVPTVSFAVRYLKASAGVMSRQATIRASITATRSMALMAARLPQKPLLPFLPRSMHWTSSLMSALPLSRMG